jgi:hypothetical protein
MPKTTKLGGASYEEDRVPDDVKAEADAKATEDAGKGENVPSEPPRKRGRPRKRTQTPTGQG